MSSNSVALSWVNGNKSEAIERLLRLDPAQRAEALDLIVWNAVGEGLRSTERVQEVRFLLSSAILIAYSTGKRHAHNEPARGPSPLLDVFAAAREAHEESSDVEEAAENLHGWLSEALGEALGHNRCSGLSLDDEQDRRTLVLHLLGEEL